MTDKRVYVHSGADPLHTDHREVTVGPTCTEGVALISSTPAGGRPHDGSIYIDRENTASAVVALLVSTGFCDSEGVADADPHQQRMHELARAFVDAFREAMVPLFRERMRAALDEAEDDWDAKCRVSGIINEYESLR